ncbi:hypothetical protein MAMC_01966 [Methylacidimicrobium cyclopophantes]|uniref:Uncharacterized protein n=1 Tax=Methylacidimicrobium cyclopophantes TaxID=1041766 RepID=A0A5E6MJE1_9BACT|nr:hypothetical protein [Methylacidimicrobium cyclopophantes]VVM08075.1 hypothetical protein MAMC_01966 [Methylacidimicrobium cyclopophantes]
MVLFYLSFFSWQGFARFERRRLAVEELLRSRNISAVTESELEERAKRAMEILKAPAEYKVCEGCESIVRKKAVFCPNCHGYRFDSEPARVVEQARILGGRPANSISQQDYI